MQSNRIKIAQFGGATNSGGQSPWVPGGTPWARGHSSGTGTYNDRVIDEGIDSLIMRLNQDHNNTHNIETLLEPLHSPHRMEEDSLGYTLDPGEIKQVKLKTQLHDKELRRKKLEEQMNSIVENASSEIKMQFNVDDKPAFDSLLQARRTNKDEKHPHEDKNPSREASINLMAKFAANNRMTQTPFDPQEEDQTEETDFRWKVPPGGFGRVTPLINSNLDLQNSIPQFGEGNYDKAEWGGLGERPIGGDSPGEEILADFYDSNIPNQNLNYQQSMPSPVPPDIRDTDLTLEEKLNMLSGPKTPDRLPNDKYTSFNWHDFISDGTRPPFNPGRVRMMPNNIRMLP